MEPSVTTHINNIYCILSMYVISHLTATILKAAALESQLLGLKQMVAEKQSFAEEATRAREEAVLVSEARPLSLGVVNILPPLRLYLPDPMIGRPTLQDLKAAQDSLARQAIRCTELQTEVVSYAQIQ